MTSVQSETGVLAGDERMLIDGEPQNTASGATFEVIHPASEEVAGRATDGTDATAKKASENISNPRPSACPNDGQPADQ